MVLAVNYVTGGDWKRARPDTIICNHHQYDSQFNLCIAYEIKDNKCLILSIHRLESISHIVC